MTRTQALLLLLPSLLFSACDTESVTKEDSAVPAQVDDESRQQDNDGDSWSVANGDCDDSNDNVFPGAEELCNGLDDNCNGVADEGFSDTDGDGLVDCMDRETCDGVDNDGDGEVDEGYPDDDGDGRADCLGSEDACDGIDNDGDGEIDEDFDFDGDGYTQCGSDTTPADCDDTDASVYPGATEADGDLIDNDCDSLVDEGGWVGDELLITEIMTNPDNVDDTMGEWFEVLNVSDHTLLLNGLVLSSTVDGDYHVVSSKDLLIVEPGEFFVFARSDNPFDNGALVNVGYAYGADISLSNEVDGLVIEADGTLLDLVEWDDGATFPDAYGASMSLDPTFFDTTMNDVGDWWCQATQQWDTATDRGSPGASNQYCWPSAVPAYSDTSSLVTCDTLYLDGSASSDPTGMPLTFEWELASAPAGSILTTSDIEETTDVSPVFVPDVPGTYVFTLTVDNGTESSPAVPLVVDIALRSYNTPPTADAGDDQTASVTASCTPIAYGAGGYDCDSCSDYDFELDGTGSSDPDGDWLADPQWTIVSGVATIVDEDTWEPTVTVTGPATASYGVPDSQSIEVELSITDCMGATDTDLVTLTYTCTGG